MYKKLNLHKYQKKSLPLQCLHLKRMTNGHPASGNRINTIRWHYTAQPTPVSRVYEILIKYKLNCSPKVFVISPDLNSLTNKEIPHIYPTKDSKYKDGTCLCLYQPKYGEWLPNKLLTKTIVPWVDLWLFYFEEWLIKGIWKGGGEHP